ncbi:hypothetical protein GTP38_25165 [Duganella sp. FT94W]|uniref:Uncharacterized protein n=1 Tax=Duganella lactea TaxID=2692173 RepID=A0ABW9VFH6_9BURK|nr:hypothetical protein [Duganella lactea]MYM37620.1 hypothetical protein [Duganella lactea]
MTALAYFLGRLETLLDRNQVAYEAYLSKNRIFLYAEILKNSSDSISFLLLDNMHLLPAVHRINAMKLLHHLDVWGGIWESTYAEIKPGIYDEFSFENIVNFPSKEVADLRRFYRILQGRLHIKNKICIRFK